MFASINIAHQNRNPSAPRACFRILGFFDTEEAAKENASKREKDVDIYLVPCSRWILLSKHADSDQLELLNELGKRYQQRLSNNEKEFEENVHSQRTGQTSTRACGNKDEGGSRECGLPAGGALASASIPRSDELRMQTYAIISIIDDTSTDDETEKQPAIIFWAYTETEDAARDKIKEDLALTIKDVALDVVSMYEWLAVPSFRDGQLIEEEWRDDKLNEIMNTKKLQSKRVKDYESECRREGRTPKCIEIENSKAADEIQVGSIPIDPPNFDHCGDAITVGPSLSTVSESVENCVL